MVASTDRAWRWRHRLIAFEDWKPGEYGVRPASQTGPNQFTGQNVCRYDNGLLGPRFGVKAITISGTTVPSGVVRGFGFNYTITGAGVKAVWSAVGNHAYLMNIDGSGSKEATGTFNTTLTLPVYGAAQNQKTYIAGADLDGVYVLDHVAETLTKITGSPANPDFIVQFGETMLTTGPFNLVRYSSPGDPSSWPAGNFFAVGPVGSYIVGAIPQRDHLIFTKLEGGWWVMRGSLGQTGNIQSAGTAVLRKITDTMPIVGNDSAAVTQDGNIVFVRASRTSTVVSALFSHNGSTLAELAPYVPFSIGDSTYYDNARVQVVALRQPRAFFALARPALSPGELVMFNNGAWSKHIIDPPGATFPAIARTGDIFGQDVMFGDLGAAATTPKFWRWTTNQRRVAFTSDNALQPGDDSTTPIDAFFTTHEWLSDAGYEAKVAAVTVDFRNWTTGSPSSNHFDLNVITTKAMEANGDITSSTLAFDDPSGSLGAATDAGVDLTRKFGFGGSAWGRGFKIKLSNIRGLAIERILVHVDVRESRSV